MKVRAGMVSAVVAGGLLLTACSSGGSGGTVKGNLDDVKFKASSKAVPAKTHKETKQEKKYKEVCTSRKKGRCVSKTKIFDGYKTVTVTVTDKPGKPYKAAKYCIELDNVKGNLSRDDVWFNVSQSTYNKFKDTNKGKKIRLKYNREGC